MIDFEKYKQSARKDCCFSIIIPSWNNLKYLELCVNSLRKNSAYPHQIIIAVNEGLDGTLEWVEAQGLDYIYAKKNIGICYALNACRSLIDTQFVFYANDDMYFLPNWDKPILEKINELTENQQYKSKYYMISSTLVEPSGNNPSVVVKDFGHDIETFREADLLKEYSNLQRNDWSGSTWPPNVMPLDCWDLVGGMSIEFSPGMYSDPDISRKLWAVGVRDFIGVGNSLVYHFGCKSTGRIKKNKGKNMFVLKWGISAHTFMKHYLRQGNTKFTSIDESRLPKPNNIKQLIKRIVACLKKQ
ncbi:MAG: glycosyltransferase [Bacteroidales bacterium]|nr:glycosyltransferase [Bacteroidales bacterium]